MTAGGDFDVSAPDTIDDPKARIAELEAALRPFAASVFNDNDDVTISTGDIGRDDYLRAYRALKGGAND